MPNGMSGTRVRVTVDNLAFKHKHIVQDFGYILDFSEAKTARTQRKIANQLPDWLLQLLSSKSIHLVK